MAQKDTTHTEFRTALEMTEADDRVTTQICDVCSEIHSRPFWSRHEKQPDGNYECLTCRERQVPQDQQATDADVREAVADELGER